MIGASQGGMPIMELVKFSVSLVSSWDSDWKDKTDDEREAENARRKARIAELGGYFLGYGNFAIGSAECFVALILDGLVERYADQVERVVIKTPDHGRQQLEMLFDKVLAKLADAPAEVDFNQRCQQAQPGAGLHSIDTLKLMEDACTDAVQFELSKGWHIVAVQPQPNQRRADFILGRRGSSIPTSAERG